MRFPRRLKRDSSTGPTDWRPATTPPAAAARAAHDEILSIARSGGGGAYGYAGLRSPAQAAEVIGHLAHLARDLDPVLTQVDRYLRREDTAQRLESLEGPFAGDARAAVGTSHMWLSEAAVAADKLREALDNAQIATSGLARPTHRTSETR